MNVIVNINNCPEYAKNHKFIIARNDEGELWFYGAFDDKAETERIARDLGANAIIIPNQKGV